MLDSYIFLAVIFIFGVIIGSFLNSVIYRLSLTENPAIRNILKEKRSYCPACKHQLSAFDLVPVVSFLFLGGKCRYCRHPISFVYPLVELGTGLLFLLVFLTKLPLVVSLQNSITALVFFYVISSLVVIFFYDLKHFIIPDVVLFPALVVATVYHIATEPAFFFTNSLWASLGLAGFFALLHFGSRGEWMGFGDVKLALLLGVFLGFPSILPAVFLAFFVGALIGLLIIVFFGKNLKSQIPFAPFLITGTLAAFFWGEQIIQWYISLFVW